MRETPQYSLTVCDIRITVDGAEQQRDLPSGSLKMLQLSAGLQILYTMPTKGVVWCPQVTHESWCACILCMVFTCPDLLTVYGNNKAWLFSVCLLFLWKKIWPLVGGPPLRSHSNSIAPSPLVNKMTFIVRLSSIVRPCYLTETKMLVINAFIGLIYDQRENTGHINFIVKSLALL